MTTKLAVHAVAVLVSAFSILASNAQAQSNSKRPDSPVVVGKLKSVDSSGTKFDVQQSGEHLRKLYVNSESKVYFVGLPAKGGQKPRAGQGVKATCEKDGRVKTISFTPPVGEPSMLGEKRLTMTESELLKEVDKDASNSISYVEFSKYIYHSPKHGPDSFRKADKDSDGVLDTAEFVEALSKVYTAVRKCGAWRANSAALWLEGILAGAWLAAHDEVFEAFSALCKLLRPCYGLA